MAIQPWLEEQWQALLNARDQQDLLQQLIKTAQAFGFDYCAFGLRAPYPLTAPKTMLANNYSLGWQESYRHNNYLPVDPIVQHGLRSSLPLVWSGDPSLLPFWEEARAQGICYGWSQAHCNSQNFIGMLTLARGGEPITQQELLKNEASFSWLTQLAYAGFNRFMAPELIAGGGGADLLTDREKEVLRWTADGKSASEIALLMNVSERTVSFHINHVLSKLGAANKTAATVQAVLLGLL